MQHATLRCVIVSLAIFVFAAGARGQVKLLPGQDSDFDDYGIAVAVFGDMVIVGTPLDDDNGLDAGAVYLYQCTGGRWTHTAKLVPPGHDDDVLFGISVGICNDVIVVGASGDTASGEFAGAAHIYRRDAAGTWCHEAKLVPPGDSDWNHFGASVAISETLVVIGAYGDDEIGSNAGAAHVYRDLGGLWVNEGKLLPSAGADGGQAGISVDVSQGRIAVGANLDDDAGPNAGAMYIFERRKGAWQCQAKLTPPAGSGADQFGIDVAIHGTVAVSGAFLDDDAGSNAGAAYTYRISDGVWYFEQKLTPTFNANLDQFGGAVEVDEGRIVVGAVRDDDAGTDAGATYVFGYGSEGWTEQTKLVPPADASADLFGFDVAARADIIVAGAPTDDDAGMNAGAVYVLGCAAIAPPCPADLDGDDVVSFSDALRVLSRWGDCPEACPEDIDGSGVVGSPDLLAVLTSWGDCPG